MGWGDAQGGRPRKLYVRRRVDYPPPNPQPTPCRIWQGSVDRYGYGRVAVHSTDNKRRMTTASRWIWTMANGPIPEGQVVRHKCDNPPCFRLSHLELGSVADNNEDARQRGHLGAPSALSPSQIEAVRLGRAAGMSYPQIYADWPEIRERVTIRGLRWIGKKLENGWQPAPPTPPGYDPATPASARRRVNPAKETAAAKYATWRLERGRPEDDPGTGTAV
jgi:hypothetical protein